MLRPTHCVGGKSYTRRCVFAEDRRVGVVACQFAFHRFLHVRLSLQVAPLAGEQPYEGKFVVPVGLYSQFATKVAVGDEALIELGDLERVRKVVRILGARPFDEKDEEPIEIVHGFAEMRSGRASGVHAPRRKLIQAARRCNCRPRWTDTALFHHRAPRHIQLGATRSE